MNNSEKEKACGCIIIENGKVLLIQQIEGHWGFPKGHMEDFETESETAIREVKEETGLIVTKATYLFSFNNTYLYSNLNIPTLDLFYLCEVENCDELHAADDAEDCLWVPLKEIRVEEFGLQSLRRGIERFLSMNT